MNRISLSEKAHHIIREYLQPGNRAIDATIGNGHDTVFLAQHVGTNGHVFGFDIQQEAIKSTHDRLAGSGLLSITTLFKTCHSKMAENIPKQHRRGIKAIMFNLGYLPGSDKSIITHAETSLLAFNAACNMLASSGILTILVYPDHPGGADEMDSLFDWLNDLDRLRFCYSIIDSKIPYSNGPRLICITAVDARQSHSFA